MNVVVDTSVWSLALRRTSPRGTSDERELTELIIDGRVLLLGVVRQELLSGIRGQEQFKTTRDALRAFPDVVLERVDHERAAECFNSCRAKGVQGSNTDFLICAVSLRLRAAIFTTDHDFTHYARTLQLKLHYPAK